MTVLTHVGIHDSANKNAGDTLLFQEVRNAIDSAIPDVTWERRQLWDPLEADATNQINSTAGVVIGGGGLLLRDQAGADSSASGWQWNTTTEALGRIDVPIIVFAIGYNRFRNQPDFEPQFTDHIRALVDRAAFFSLRNKGSIRAVSNYLPDDLAAKLQLQPCPTTVLHHLRPELVAQVDHHRNAGKKLLRFNVAFDRPEMRFGQDPTTKLQSLGQSMRHASQTGWDVHVTCHKTLDLQILPYLDEAGATYVVDDLTDADPDEILATYCASDLTVGLRGHAQMIPFGLRRPIISVISHDKMGWFLDDIEHPEWGVEVDEPMLTSQICDRIDDVAANRDTYEAQLAASETALWDKTQQNLAKIRLALAAKDQISRDTTT